MMEQNRLERCRDILTDICTEVLDVKESLECDEYDDLHSVLEWDISDIEDRIWEARLLIDECLQESN